MEVAYKVQTGSKGPKMTDSSSSESLDGDFVFYKDRPEWADLRPVEQDEGPFPVVQIAYSDKFRDVFDYLRSVLRSNEKSERAFLLTSDAGELNPANYTVWHYRRILLKALDKDLKAEVNYIGEMIREHPKTYQLWHHRSVIVGWLQDASEELSFTEKILKGDAKNYHAWQHRQWAIRNFELWDNELEFINRLLKDDVRNNSAWNQRYFVISSTTTFVDEVLKEEVVFTMECIRKAVHNESAWNYLSGILFDKDLSKYPGLDEFTSSLYNSMERSSYLLSFMIDLHENELELGCEKAEEVLQRVVLLCNSLEKEHDTIRCEYWKFVARKLAHQYGKVSNSA